MVTAKGGRKDVPLCGDWAQRYLEQCVTGIDTVEVHAFSVL